MFEQDATTKFRLPVEISTMSAPAPRRSSPSPCLPATARLAVGRTPVDWGRKIKWRQQTYGLGIIQYACKLRSFPLDKAAGRTLFFLLQLQLLLSGHLISISLPAADPSWSTTSPPVWSIHPPTFTSAKTSLRVRATANAPASRFYTHIKNKRRRVPWAHDLPKVLFVFKIDEELIKYGWDEDVW